MGRWEGIFDDLHRRMDAIETRMNVQIGLTIAMWLSLGGLMITLLLRQ